MEQSVCYIYGSVQRYPPANIPAFQSWLTILYPKRRFTVPFQHSKSRFSAPIAFRYHPGTPTIAFWFHSGNHSSTQASLSGTPPAPLAFRYHSDIRTVAFRYHFGTTSLGLRHLSFYSKPRFSGTFISTPSLAFRHVFVQISVNIYGAVFLFPRICPAIS